MKRKLFQDAVSQSEENSVNSERSSEEDYQSAYPQPEGSGANLEMPSGKARSEHSNVIGEDIDTLEMNIEDCVQQLCSEYEEYPYSYLLDCRRKLMMKVDNYRKRLEQAYTQNSKLIYKHRKEVERIRAFYQSIVHLPTRAGRILKASQGKTSAARQVLEEFGLKYVFDGEKYIVNK